MRRRNALAPALGVAAMAVLAACGSTAPGDTGQFIPLQKDFADFRSWTRFDLGVGVDPARAATDTGDGGVADGGGADGAVHVVAPRAIYLNMIPPTGSTTFPVGSILIKTTGEGTATPGDIFGMAKRGGSYNMKGAAGWEWFELVDGTDGKPLIVWRGIVPPAGEGYAGIVGGVCNDCHATFAYNDFVGSNKLLLSTF